MKLFIGNKNYSSWSFRVWLTLKMHDIEFEEDVRPFDVENDYADFFEFSPTGKVPVLLHGEQTIWESLSILEYVSELFPEKKLWPENINARAHARSLANEMHAGFTSLRPACPMNMRRKIETIPIDSLVRKDIKRIESIWTDCLNESGGPFLFGDRFTIADGMFAPIVNRFQIYELSNIDAVKRYTETLTGLDHWKDWSDASRAETWVVDIDEDYA